MRFFIPVLLVLLQFSTLSMRAYASHINPAEPRQVALLQGIYVKTGSAATFKTEDETYLLVDKRGLLKNAPDTPLAKQASLIMQSFRLCLSGYLLANHEKNYSQYPQLLVVEQVCEVSQ